MKCVILIAATICLWLLPKPLLAQSGPQASALDTAYSITTRLSLVALPEPADDDGLAAIRIATEVDDVVYRGLMPIAAGARSLDLSAVRIPAAGRHTLRIVYPGGTLTQEIETPYTTSAEAVERATAAR